MIPTPNKSIVCQTNPHYKMNKIISILICFGLATSCVTPKCYKGIFDTKALLELDKKWKSKIISNETLFTNETITLLNSEFECSKKMTRTMKVILDKDDSTMMLVPQDSEFRDDSILYVNSRFFISPLESGLIVSNKVEGRTTRFEYPEDDTLHALTKNQKRNGLYRYDHGEFKLVTESLSKKAFKTHCSNDTCYIPYPGILYDKKINLMKLKSLQ